MLKLILSSLLLIQSLALFAQYQPTSSGQVVKHSYYTLSYIEEHEQPEWVYYKLSPELVKGDQGRTDNFRPDPKVSTVSASLADYTASGYDRGHLCPAGDMKASEAAMSESFYMSNMSPQLPSFNRGIWKKLEATVRYWGMSENIIYVVTAGVLTSNSGHIGANKVTIPKSYYKVIYAPKSQKMIGFVLPNVKSNQPLQSFVVSVDEVERRTGIDFFPQLDDAIEGKLEAQSNSSDWLFKQYSSSSSATKSKSLAVQCKGKAKSTGNRCKNNTTNTNGYCNIHQHQGT